MSSYFQKSIDNRGVATLTLNRTDVHNAFNDALISELTDTLTQLSADDTIRAVVLTGDGPSFCAGADVNWMRSIASAGKSENKEDALRLATLMRTLNYLPKPTLARVNGAAIGGGVGLIACCDSAITVDTAKFGLTEARLGLVPAVIAPYVFRKIGETAARHYFLSAQLFGAEVALRSGLVHSSVPEGQLDTAVERHVDQLLKTGPAASHFSKQLVFSVAGHDENKQRQVDEVTAELIAELRASDEGQEGLAAFLEKRAANWVKKA